MFYIRNYLLSEKTRLPLFRIRKISSFYLFITLVILSYFVFSNQSFTTAITTNNIAFKFSNIPRILLKIVLSEYLNSFHNFINPSFHIHIPIPLYIYISEHMSNNDSSCISNYSRELFYNTIYTPFKIRF